MPLLTWHDDYSVNNEELDGHHRELMAILNRLYSQCLDVDAVECASLRLEELLAFVDYHFKAEEQYMRRIEYFDVDEHIEMHKGFAFKLEEMKRIPYASQLELTRELIVFIGKWFLHHVLAEDRKYAVYATNRGYLQDSSSR